MAAAKTDTLLIMGGKPIGSREIAEYAKARGSRVIVADYLPPEQSPAKQIADEAWDVSTADLDELERRCRRAGVTAVLAGVHEFNIEKALELCGRLGLPTWCTLDQWTLCNDKGRFKELCRAHGIDVARRYAEGEIASLPADAFPVAVKPLDGSGSRGFAKCYNAVEALAAVERAKGFSPTGNVLVEEFIDSNAVIVQYTAHDGRVLYSGMTDKLSLKADAHGAPIMALQLAPSVHEAEYLESVNDKAVRAFESIGLSEGPIWVEAFYQDGRFVFNEMGLRFGGSMTNLLVKRMGGIDQMAVLYDAALGLKGAKVNYCPVKGSVYAIWPVHLKPGKIVSVEGLDEVESDVAFEARTMVHGIGDEIDAWGSAQQVLAYLHFRSETASGLLRAMSCAKAALSVKGENEEELLYSLFDPDDPSQFPRFLRTRLAEGRRE